jgi:hypothetical protein
MGATASGEASEYSVVLLFYVQNINSTEEEKKNRMSI